MKKRGFQAVEEQIGSCGLWCGSCAAANGVFQELAEKFAETVDIYDLKEWGPKDFDFSEFRKGLTSLQNMSCCPGCLKGGGRPDCPIRSCAQEKGWDDCSQCLEISSCPNQDDLSKMREGAQTAGMKLKTENLDNSELLGKWKDEMRKAWPSLILFLD